MIGFFIVSFKPISRIAPLFPLFTLNKSHISCVTVQLFVFVKRQSCNLQKDLHDLRQRLASFGLPKHTLNHTKNTLTQLWFGLMFQGHQFPGNQFLSKSCIK